MPRHLSEPPGDGLLRIVLLLNDEHRNVALLPFMGDDDAVGTETNAIYFSQSKYLSKRLKMELERKQSRRSYLVYDADLPPVQRREMERRLNDPSARGNTVLATSALELGVDIEGLDVCFIEQIPPSRADLLQRIGRVGARVGRPGLVFLRLSAEPQDQQILEDPCAAMRLDLSEPLPIPLQLDMLRWRHVLAVFSEWEWDMRRGAVRLPSLRGCLARHFGESRSRDEVQRLFEERYGSLVDLQDTFWAHQGFRASAGGHKIPLKDGEREVARIDDISLFRDAHPEAVYLAHDLSRYRVIDYHGEWKAARPGPHDGDAAVGTWLRSIKAVQVQRELAFVTTRGSWDEWFHPQETRHFTDESGCPRKGDLELGIWDYVRMWQGYTEINLETEQKRRVSLGEVTERFNRALKRGDRFPFLHNWSYRTQGWQWDFGAVALARAELDWQFSLGDLVAHIIEHFFAQLVESRVADIGVQLDLVSHTLHVLDSTPGGNGLAETLLTGGRIPSALQELRPRSVPVQGQGRRPAVSQVRPGPLSREARSFRRGGLADRS